MSRARGFTLVEMVIAVAVILVLASLVLGLFGSNVEEAKRLHTEMLIQNLDLACKAYKNERGAYPPDDRLALHLGQERTQRLEVGASTKRPPYLELRADWVEPTSSAVIDAWGRPIRYQAPGVRNTTHVDVWSAGPNGQAGDVDDVGNWKD